MKRDYSQEEITKGLLSVAYWNGNCRKASAFLKEGGVKVPQKTLWRWYRQQYVAEYEQLRTEILPKVREKAAEDAMSLAESQREVAMEATEALKGKMDEIKPRDLSTTVRNMSVAAGVETDKAQLLAGQPTAIVMRSASEVLRSLKAKGVRIEDAEVVSEEDVPTLNP
jgi:hypothetical protein